MIKMIGFDLDGTIADTISMCIKAFSESVSPYTDHTLSREEILRTFGLNEVGMIKAICAKYSKNAIRDFYEKYEYYHQQIQEPFPGIRELLAFLKQNNISIVLITGKGEPSCSISLEKLGLEGVFDEILCGSEHTPNKSDSIHQLLKKYSISPTDFYYIGDTLSDIDACKHNGVTCLSAAWQNNSNYELLEKENPHYVFYSVSEISDFIQNMLHV